MLSACIVEVPPGPDLGKCARVPEGVYQYGEAAIGTCIAGPADLQFFEHEGGTFLAVTNADPFQNFRAGSLLVLDWADLSARLGGDETRIPVDEVTAYDLEIRDDDNGDGVGGNAFLGGFGYLPDSQTAVVASRLTEDAVLRSGRDELFVLDLKDMEGQGIRELGEIVLEDDPFPVVVDSAADRVYVGNLTDHSVSVLTTARSTGDLPLAKVDVAPGAGATDAVLTDADASGTLAEVTRLAIDDPELVAEDRWTLTFVDATTRLYVPTFDADEGVVGPVRYTSGDTLAYAPTAFGIEQVEDTAGDRVAVLDPFVEVGDDEVPVLWFSNPTGDGRIFRALAVSIEAGEWLVEPDPVHSGGIHGSPSVAPLPGEIGLYTDVQITEQITEGDEVTLPTSAINLSTSSDGVVFSDDRVILEPPPGTSYEDPFAVFDSGVGRYRMWLTVRTATATTVALSESDDGISPEGEDGGWTTPETVLAPLGRDAGAPVVAVLDGRYVMWTALSDGTRWDHAVSWSYDGRHWTDPVVVVEGQLDFDAASPTRAAVVTDRVGAWRVEGVDQGALPALLPAGASAPTAIFGYEIAVASGHEIENGVVPGRRADLGLVPGSFVRAGGLDLLYATVTGSGSRDRIVVLGPTADGWATRVSPDDMDAQLGVGPGETASSPLVVPDGDGFVMFVTITDSEGARLLLRATSDDGLAWTEAGDRVLPEDAEVTWDAAGQFAHSLEVLDSGRVRLWYEGSDGSRTRIGSALADGPTARFAREPGTDGDWRLGTGTPGGFDDSSVADPLAVRIAGQTHLYWSGFDGAAWRLGHALVGADGSVTPRIDEDDTLFSVAAMSGAPRTFSAAGVISPVLREITDDRIDLFYAGSDGLAWRAGLASVDTDAPDMVFAEQRFPTARDTLTYETLRGGVGEQVVELGQSTQWYISSGVGMSSVTPDPQRGFLYVTTKLDDQVYVVDVRDDSDGTFRDANYLDLEGIIRVDTGSAIAGFRDAVVSRTRGLLYLTMRNPDGLAIIDLTRITDDDDKAPYDSAAVAFLPLRDLSDDAGVDTAATFGGAGMALTADERLLLVTHFRSNAVAVFDLEQGAWGQEVAWITNVGENPHVVRISPDGRWAVVANYLGDVVGGTVSSTLAFVDLDPESERYLEVVQWLVNKP